MPVLGHAFVGLGTAVCTSPASRTRAVVVLWAPTLVGLAYLPDIVSQMAAILGFTDVRVVTHSALFAICAAVPVGGGLAKLGAISRPAAFSIAVLSILLHDVLDLLQGTDQQLGWPFSGRHLGLDLHVIPMNSRAELFLFGVPFCLFVAAWTALRHRVARADSEEPGKRRIYSRAIWTSRVLTAAILVAASTTHYLRGMRDQQSEEVYSLLQAQKIGAAITLIESAERWPSTVKPGRLDYAVAEAHALNGDRSQSERHYLRAYDADPDYFWVVADLAVFYATSDLPAGARRLQAEPYLRRLRSEFADHPDLPRILGKVDRKLARPRSGKLSGKH